MREFFLSYWVLDVEEFRKTKIAGKESVGGEIIGP